MTITVPIPPRILHPNSRGHWAAVARAKRDTRTTAHIMGQRAVAAAMYPKPMTAPVVQLRYFFPRKRRRDGDGLLSLAKATFDGLTDAGVWEDDSLCTHLPVVVDVDKGNPRLEVVVSEA